MTDIAIQAEKLSKCYQIQTSQAGKAQYVTLRDTLVEVGVSALRRVRRREPVLHREPFWALRDISFEIKQGEVVGIIGRNGSGKSTLLKVLSRITEPTTGRAEIHGRVGSLLEVGTGFHQELTGRENIYLNGAILGMKRAEIERKFDEIVAFAEIDKFLDTPVKRYSSGMYVRLAFAVAAHMEPEILLVDEVLAVGDAAFQKKCLGKMGEVARGGRTVLFVSHNMGSVQRLCNRAIWLSQGEMQLFDNCQETVSAYLNRGLKGITESVWDDLATAPGNDRVRVHSARIRLLEGNPGDPITLASAFAIEFEFWNLKPGAYLRLSLPVVDENDNTIFISMAPRETPWYDQPFPEGLFRATCNVPAHVMNDGKYHIDLYIIEDASNEVYHHDAILMFDIVDDMSERDGWYGKWLGAVRPRLQWDMALLGEPTVEISKC